MINALKDFLHLFFAFDHYNYARWDSTFFQDFETLPERVRAEFETDASLFIEVIIVLPLYLLIMHMSR